jgi:hypothetical protein
MRHSIVAIVGLLAIAGCAPEYIRYEPDRQAVRSIPAEKAREAIRERLGRGKGVANVSVSADRFQYTAGGAKHDLSYKATQPAIYMRSSSEAGKSGGSVGMMALPPPKPEYVVYFTGTPLTDAAELVALAEREDAEVLVDALASLGAEVPAPPAAR